MSTPESLDVGGPLATPPDDLAAQVAADVPVGGDEVDPGALLAAIQQMQDRVAQLEAEKRTAGAAPLLATSEALRAALGEHASGKTTGQAGSDAYAEALSLADDLVEASRNAVNSGDGSAPAKIAPRLVRALARAHPGPGDHHYWRQAESFLADVPDQAESLSPVQGFVAVGGRAPAKVVQGSVTG